jgi:hypothetical protein
MSNRFLCIVRSGLALAFLIGAAGNVNAGPILFIGLDPGAGPGQPRPNADLAAASFDAAARALSPLSLINFENTPVGEFGGLQIAPGVSMTSSGTASVVNFAGTAQTGYNTTENGMQFVNVPYDFPGAGRLAFGFQQPVEAFGAYVTGAQQGSLSPLAVYIGFTNGTSQLIPITTPLLGGALFIGFTDPGESVRQVGLFAPVNYVYRYLDSSDTFSVDDVRFGTIPEPATTIFVLLGILTLLDFGLRRRKRGLNADAVSRQALHALVRSNRA